MTRTILSDLKGAASRPGPTIRLSRAYDAPPKRRAYRILVDRIWPRGIKKESLALDAWLKELAPSTELRRWFNHVPERWPEFRKRYFKELGLHADGVDGLAEIASKCGVTLVYGARDPKHNNAVALREYLLRKLDRRTSSRDAK
jgi:uncharacterized protein YeaO (DUF488 family)